ncbi:hypothetical protein BC835DRAFT_1309304 [Cytidiella melzeri]|nr:hypothetical protein BC835DRAFT_1309304 [Cytidiella melzeri]
MHLVSARTDIDVELETLPSPWTTAPKPHGTDLSLYSLHTRSPQSQPRWLTATGLAATSSPSSPLYLGLQCSLRPVLQLLSPIETVVGTFALGLSESAPSIPHGDAFHPGTHKSGPKRVRGNFAERLAKILKQEAASPKGSFSCLTNFVPCLGRSEQTEVGGPRVTGTLRRGQCVTDTMRTATQVIAEVEALEAQPRWTEAAAGRGQFMEDVLRTHLQL